MRFWLLGGQLRLFRRRAMCCGPHRHRNHSILHSMGGEGNFQAVRRASQRTKQPLVRLGPLSVIDQPYPAIPVSLASEFEAYLRG
jgi:hypothetical protein